MSDINYDRYEGIITEDVYNKLNDLLADTNGLSSEEIDQFLRIFPFESKLLVEEPEQSLKFDSHKPDLALLDRMALEELARVMNFGAHKYGRDNWRKGMDHSRYISAALRHIMAYNDGEDNDIDSGLNHLAHAMANCMILVSYIANGKGVDDRHKEE